MADRPRAFASLRERGTMLAYVRDAQGRRVQQQVPVTNVKALAGFTRCRFVYNSDYHLACYVPGTIAQAELAALEAKLVATADGIGSCLANPNLTRATSEEGSMSAITFGGGATQPFWQVSMVPVDEEPSQMQAEVLILGPAVTPQIQRVAPRSTPRPSRATPKTKRATR